MLERRQRAKDCVLPCVHHRRCSFGIDDIRRALQRETRCLVGNNKFAGRKPCFTHLRLQRKVKQQKDGSVADNILSIHTPAIPNARGLGSIVAGQQILPGSFSVLN